MQPISIKSQINGKSLAAFAVLIIFSFGMAWVVLSKTNDAIEEFDRINAVHSGLIKKQLEGSDVLIPPDDI